MKKIALFSPLSPIKSGISYFTEDILPFLRKKYDIEIFVDNFNPEKEDVLANHKIYDISEFEKRKDKYILNIYQIGNNPYHKGIISMAEKYPGIVILHDFALHHIYAHKFLIEKKDFHGYLELLKELHGKDAYEIAANRNKKGELGLWETDAIAYPMNKILVEKSLGVVVFSEFARCRLLEYGYNIPIHRLYLYSGEEDITISKENKATSKKQLGYKKNDLLITSFGFIQNTKRPLQLLEAFANIGSDNAKLIFVGEIQDNIEKEFYKTIKSLNIEKKVIVTGFIDEDRFKKYLMACDINISLRYPSVGETSGVLMRAFAYGNPSIVTDIGAFSELPDNTVLKVSWGENEVSDIEQALSKLLNDTDLRNKMGTNAKIFADTNLKLSTVCGNLSKYIDQIISIEEIRNHYAYYEIIKKYGNSISGLGINIKYLDKTIESISEIF